MEAERQCLSSCGPGCCRVVSVVVYSGLGVETCGLFRMATEQMAQMFGQLQQLNQQLVNQQQMCQQSPDMQRGKLSPILALRKLPRRRTMPATLRQKQRFEG